MKMRLLTSGFAIWAAATLYLRLDGQRLLHPRPWPATLALFALSFAAMALLARRLCRKARLPSDQWPAGAVALALPTLLFDPFSTAFFSAMFPNIAPEMPGAFGGGRLWC